jgi:murein DD-endopeptidase MepM/ murein hydrolase activator NlpD
MKPLNAAIRRVTEVLLICAIGAPSFQVAVAGAQTSSAHSIVFPLMAPRISSTFGSRNHPVRKVHRHHNGIDLAAPENSHVRAVAAGLVVFADEYAGYGKLVTIKHQDGYISLYGHLNDIRVNPGKRVNPGDIIGRVGSTGLATGPHLHFEWRKNGKSIDPLKVFPALAKDATG